MKFKTYTGITWSQLELEGLIEDEDSHVNLEKLKKHLGLHPFHLTNLQRSVNEILSSNLNSYDPELKGFLLSYKNPKLLTALGDVFYDACFIHIDMEAHFYIFKPTVGCMLKGIVNKKGLSHIGVLVHKAFNVSIPKPENTENWPGDNVEIGQEIRFTITQLDLTSRLPFIRGALDETNYLQGCKLLNTGGSATSDTGSNKYNQSNNGDFNNVRVRKKDKYATLNNESDNTEESSSVQMEEQISSRKGSKKKKQVLNEDKVKLEKRRSKKSVDRNNEENSELEEITSSQEMQNYKHFIIPDGIEISNKERKKRKRSSEKKLSQRSRSSESESDQSFVTIKLEKDEVFNRSLENLNQIKGEGDYTTMKREKIAIKRPRNSSESINSVESRDQMYLPKKKRSRKAKTPDIEFTNTDVQIKLEESSVSERSDHSQDATNAQHESVASESRRKKISNLSDRNTNDGDANRRKKSKNYSRRSSIEDNLDFESNNIKIKTEKVNSEFDNLRANCNEDKESKKRAKRHKRKLSLNGDMQDDEDEQNLSSPVKKHVKNSGTVGEIEYNYGIVKVKTEESDDSSGVHRQKKNSGEIKIKTEKVSSNDQTVAKDSISSRSLVNHTLKEEKEETSSKMSPTKRSKRSRAFDAESVSREREESINFKLPIKTKIEKDVEEQWSNVTVRGCVKEAKESDSELVLDDDTAGRSELIDSKSHVRTKIEKNVEAKWNDASPKKHSKKVDLSEYVSVLGNDADLTEESEENFKSLTKAKVGKDTRSKSTDTSLKKRAKKSNVSDTEFTVDNITVKVERS